MVHINKVEIFGFKSFGFKNTIVDFKQGLVSISGPNGSGKSNILDAIIFAMGENRPKTMRVDKLRSLLHDIEGSRRGPKLTRVSVHFDNSDRKIPVDSDAVEITRELDGGGDNTYFLNKKKTNRGHILDLLDMANAGLHQLNAVQQGTVTRISEFSPEEKREAIENLIGLSYFDEKKTESEKQLSDADRRLEIALATMDEIKKRIDELEEERNLKLRHDVLERELNRLNAISASGKLKVITRQKEEKDAELGSLSSETRELEERRGVIKAEIGAIEGEKSAFLDNVNEFNQAKLTIDTELSSEMRGFEEANTGILAAKKHIGQMESQIPRIKQDILDIRDAGGANAASIGKLRSELEKFDAQKQQAGEEIRGINSARDAVLKQQTDILKRKSSFDAKIKELTLQFNDSQLKLSQFRSAQSDIGGKLETNSSKHGDYEQDAAKLSKLHEELESVSANHQRSVSEIKSILSNLNAKKTKIQGDIEDLGMMLEKSSKAGNQYDAKIKMVKGMMHEDYSAAKLKQNAGELGIMGLVYELISWDKKYERAVLAVGSDWVKATVVQDFAALVSLAEYVRYKNLPKLKIIPLDAIPKLRLEPPNHKGVVGILSDYVKCDRKYAALKTFLFGSVVLVDSKESAHEISKSGYRAATLEGEFFESKATVVVIDINSKISKLTKIISMSTSVDGLLASITLLRKYMQRKKHSLAKLEAGIQGYRDRLQVSETGLATSSQACGDLRLQIRGKSRIQTDLAARLSILAKQREETSTKIAKQESLVSSLRERISLTRENYSDGELGRIAGELDMINSQKSQLEIKQADVLSDFQDKHSQIAELEARNIRDSTAIQNLNDDRDRLIAQKSETERRITDLEKTRGEKNQNLVRLRQKEQELISTSGTSVSKVNEFDGRLADLVDQEKALTKKIGQLERQTYSLSRDLQDLAQSRAEIQKMLAKFGYSGNVDDFDVEPILRALDAEYRALTALNAKAPETYLEVSNRYRSMSTRKNSLEEERNSIVKFIELIEKDKRQTFLDAFDKVDKEIRHAFSKMTGGNAWLELQNEDDIFNSGISYMIQFQNKPKRESTSISGGEKTLAAIVFVLALQKLKPSPFYLFDEVDAHLDAPNSESLSKILEERAKESQFIMVSLKDSMVQKAKLIYGVYGRNGVSHVVTYKNKHLPSVATR